MAAPATDPAPEAGYRFGEKRHTDLLTQDDSIPGNRKDGFRFHHLIFVIVATPIYLWFELSFGVRLLDNIGSANDLDHTAAIEHWGRLISGCAVSLLFLSQWFGQCEKWDRPWPVRLGMAVVICLICVPVTWIAQSRVIDFYVKQGSTEITVATTLLTLTVIAGFLVIRRWLKTYGQRRKSHPVVTAVVLLLLLGTFSLIAGNITRVVPWLNARLGYAPLLAERLGKERAEAASLTLVRRGLQGGVYTLSFAQSQDLTKSILDSAEGKATLAMFPVVGSAMDQTRFLLDRPRLLKEVMYLDWNEQYGQQSYEAFKEVQRELLGIFEGPYREGSRQYAADVKKLGQAKAGAAWTRTIREAMEGTVVRPGLNFQEFQMEPEISSYLGKKLACFDCRFLADMERADFSIELFQGTQSNNVSKVLEIMADDTHFQTGHDGEAAARTYWVPIWALLFSMIGAFTHIFKLVFTVAEYAHLRTFAKVHAADSPLAQDMVASTRRILLAVMAALLLFIYFSENRVTGAPSYEVLRRQMWTHNPIVGGIAAHWTINAQAIIYPFTKKIRPAWLTFNEDPFEHWPLSLLSGLIAEETE